MIAVESIKLQHGTQQLLLTSPERWLGCDAAGAGEGGVLIAPGEAVDVPLPSLCYGQLLRYRFRCEDGLDVGFELLALGDDSSSSQELEPWSRTTELEGSARAPGPMQCVARFDNSFSWFQTKTVHFAIEFHPSVPGASSGPAQRKARDEAEERALRLAHAEELRTAAARAVQRVAILRDELQAAEDELTSLTLMREAVEATVAADRAAAAAETDAEAAEATGAAATGDDGDAGDDGESVATGGDGATEEAPRNLVLSRGAIVGDPPWPLQRHTKEGDELVAHLWRLWRRLALLDAEASVLATRLGPSELLLREVGLQRRTLAGRFGRFGAQSDLKHIVSLCLQQLSTSRDVATTMPPAPAPAAAIPAAAAPAAAAPALAAAAAALPAVAAPVSAAPAAAAPEAVAPMQQPQQPQQKEKEEEEEGGEEEGGAEEVEPDGPTVLDQLQRLSAQLLELDEAATMDVALLSEGEYQLNSVSVHGHMLQSLGSVTATTDIGAIVALCKTIAAGTLCGDLPVRSLSSPL